MVACLGALALMCLVMPQEMHTPDLAQVLEVPEVLDEPEESSENLDLIAYWESIDLKSYWEDIDIQAYWENIDIQAYWESVDIQSYWENIDPMAYWNDLKGLVIPSNVPDTPDVVIVLEILEMPDSLMLSDSLDVTDSLHIADSIDVAPAPVIPAPIKTEVTKAEVTTVATVDTTDTRRFLSKFYNALHHASTQPIRVIHYGDSQIEEDRLTTQVRRALQNRYGGGGVGILPLHQTIPTRTIWQRIMINGSFQQPNQGPKRYLVYGPRSLRRTNSKYGPMGQVAVMDNNQVAGSEDIIMQINGTGKSKNIESYFNRIRIVKSGDISISIERATSRQGDIFIVPDSTNSATIHFEGKGDIFGISLENDHGIMVDNIPMRGCAGSVFTNIAANEIQNYFTATNTRLIILQFGGNTIPFTATRKQVSQYVGQMQTQIQYLKYLAPGSSIVFVGPSDMCERRDGQLQTYPMIPVMDRALRQMAIEEEIGYFSLYEHMGGKGSMVKWKEQGLAGGDYVHFTRKGADKAGSMLAEWLMKEVRGER